MSQNVFCLLRHVRKSGELLFKDKRFYSRWISRNPVRVLYESEEDKQDRQSNKLYNEREVRGVKKENNKNVKSSREQKLLLENNILSNETNTRNLTSALDVTHSKILSESSNTNTCDPFGLSSVIVEDEHCEPEKSENKPRYKKIKQVIPDHHFSERIEGCENEGHSQETFTNNISCNNASKNTDTTVRVNLDTRKFVKLSDSDKKLSKVMLSVKSRKIREKENIIAIEGKRVIKDFIDSGNIPKMVFFSRQQDINDINLTASDTEFYKVPYKSLSLWSDVTTSAGLIAVFKIPVVLSRVHAETVLPFTVICDNVRDPGNLGSLLRVAAGAGCERVILTKGCVDLWDSKVLRSAAGAHCHLPVLKDMEWENIQAHLPVDCVTYAADNCTGPHASLPVLPYYKAVFSSAHHIAVVVGGETHGISSSAFALASTRLNVPLCSGIESLNTATAFAVIAFEIKKQLTAGSTREESNCNTFL